MPAITSEQLEHRISDDQLLKIHNTISIKFYPPILSFSIQSVYNQIQNSFVWKISTRGQLITVTTNCHATVGMPIAKPLRSLNLNFTLFILAMVRLTSLQTLNFQIHTTCWLKFAFQYICIWRLAGCALGLETTALTIRNKLTSWQEKVWPEGPCVHAQSTFYQPNWKLALRGTRLPALNISL